MIVGYTTGVFDMFHVGHLNILKQAKLSCDKLIVAVSTDELVISYKNKTPVIPYKDRLEIVSSVRYVDQVIPQIHRDKVKQYHDIHFDKMFVGDDWKSNDLFKKTEEALAKFGVEVIYIPYTKNISSTLFRDILLQFENEAKEN